MCACAAELETAAAELRDKHATAEAADESHASRKAEYADVVLAGAQAAPALAAAITTEKEYAGAGAAEAQAEEVVLYAGANMCAAHSLWRPKTPWERRPWRLPAGHATRGTRRLRGKSCGGACGAAARFFADFDGSRDQPLQ